MTCVSNTALGPRSAHLAPLVRADRDSLVLRWAPSTAGAWLVGNRAGYIVERIGVGRDGSVPQKTYERLTPVPLVPWSLDEWKARSAPTDTFSAVAAQALYGAAFVPHALEQGDVGALKNAADELSNRYSFALFAADNDAAAAYGLALRVLRDDERPTHDELLTAHARYLPEYS